MSQLALAVAGREPIADDKDTPRMIRNENRIAADHGGLSQWIVPPVVVPALLFIIWIAYGYYRTLS